MEHYSKGKNVEEPLEKERIPIPNLPKDFLWMQVRGGSKIRNLLQYALMEFPKTNSIVWTGFGPSVGKATTCAEIMKRKYENTLYQISKICYRIVDEYWDPKIPELEQIIVQRKLPMIHILLTTSPLNSEELGYQGPGSFINYGTPQSSSNLKSMKKNETGSDLVGTSKKQSKRFNKKRNQSTPNPKRN